MKKTLALAALAAIAVTGSAEARDQVRIAGSSTVLPFATVVAEQFGKTYSKFPTPIVESGGSGAGLKLFCQGVGADTIDIANASRPIKSAEIDTCKKNGVAEIEEIRIGYDGIVFASHISAPKFAYTTKDLYLAMAAEIPQGGKMVANPNTSWKQVNPSFPDEPIQTFIPGEKHGTREVFEERVLGKGCEAAGAMKVMESAGVAKDAAAKACVKVRKDGRAVDIDGDYTETLARIESNKTAIGVFGLSFYDQNRDKIQVATVEGIEPTQETIATGKYPVSRPLFFYVKKAHLGVIPGMKEYVDFFLSDRMIGSEGVTVDKGLIPMPTAELKSVPRRLQGRQDHVIACGGDPAVLGPPGPLPPVDRRDKLIDFPREHFEAVEPARWSQAPPDGPQTSVGIKWRRIPCN